MRKMVKLGDLVEFQRGYDLPKSSARDGAYPVVTSNGIMVYHDEYKSEKSIVIGRSGTVGNPQLIEEKFWPHNTTLYVKDFRNNDIEYIYYLLLNMDIGKMKSGSNIPTLNRNHLHPLNILAETDNEKQKRISRILKVIDDKIQNNNKISVELDSMAKTIYDYWFLQFEFPNEDGKPYKSSGGKMVWNEELKKEIPVDWQIELLGNLFTSNRGISYNSKTIEGYGVPMINLASFNVDGSYKESGIKTYSGQYTADKVVRPFDLLMCNTQQTAIDYKKDIIGKAFLVPDIFGGDIVTSHHVTTIQVKNDNIKYFLHRLFNTEYFHKYISGFTNGTNILGLIFSGVEKYRLEIPDDKVLSKFAELMIDIEKKKSKIIKENQELVSPMAFS